MMMRFSMRMLLTAVLGSAAAAAAGGCGGHEEGTTVQVDPEQEKQLTDSMESYYEKNEPRSQ
jgi:hypothetical protein